MRGAKARQPDLTYEHAGVTITLSGVSGEFSAAVAAPGKRSELVYSTSLPAIKKRIEKILGGDGFKEFTAFVREYQNTMEKVTVTGIEKGRGRAPTSSFTYRRANGSHGAAYHVYPYTKATIDSWRERENHRKETALIAEKRRQQYEAIEKKLGRITADTYVPGALK